MKMKRFLGIVIRVVMSILFAGVFYTGWMAVAILTIKSGFGGLAVKTIFWFLAPIVTGFGFALDLKIFDLLMPKTDKSYFGKTYKWCLASCALGGGTVCVFGPMLIVFGMFAAGTLCVILQETARVGKGSRV